MSSRCSALSIRPAGDVMVVYGWTMAEDLVKLGQR